MLTALLVIAILVFLIVVHELGHFVAAKIFGVRVDEFGVGYPPRAFSFGRIGETEYTLNWIPFGGFVRLFGEEEEHGRGSLADASRWKQATILIAGVSMNAIAAWLLFTGAYTLGILHPVQSESTGSWLMVTDVVAGSPAAAAGIERGDEVVGVSDAYGSSPTLSPEAIVDFVRERPGKELTVKYLRHGISGNATLQPAHAVIHDEAGRPAIGLGLSRVTTEAMPISLALRAGFKLTITTFKAVFGGIVAIARDVLVGSPNLRNVVGPIGIAGAVGQAAQNGWGYVLSLAAFISINLAIINLIPIPALDGGRLLLIGIESLMQRRVSRLALQSLNAIGIALIILLMVTVTYQDIARLFT
ncbi:site-2 protease family protein [Candidatus Kaiserbacteria bacterium]|nr:site-2 protease family protein [Candidatus Kaiserbacteria bacterium]